MADAHTHLFSALTSLSNSANDMCRGIAIGHRKGGINCTVASNPQDSRLRGVVAQSSTIVPEFPRNYWIPCPGSPRRDPSILIPVQEAGIRGTRILTIKTTSDP